VNLESSIFGQITVATPSPVHLVLKTVTTENQVAVVGAPPEWEHPHFTVVKEAATSAAVRIHLKFFFIQASEIASKPQLI
jgi:hypothetical protein